MRIGWLASFICCSFFGAHAQTLGRMFEETSPLALEAQVGAGQDTLFSTLTGVPMEAFGITSQSFTGDPSQFKTFASDDFTISSDDLGWRLETVQVVGVYFGGGDGPAAGLNIYILRNDGTNPPMSIALTGPDVLFSGTNLPYTDLSSGDFLVNLPGDGITLPPGDYWILMQAEMAISPGGQWGWAESATAPDSGISVLQESVWYQTEPFLAGGNCEDAWGRRLADCNLTRDPSDGTPNEPDFAFALMGRRIPKLLALNPDQELRTSENGGTDSYNVRLTQQPAENVTVTIDSPDDNEVQFQTPAGLATQQILQFTTSNWNTDQTVTLRGIDDGLADGNKTLELAHETQSSDPEFDQLPFITQSLVNVDNECNGTSILLDQLPDFPMILNVQDLMAALCLP